MHLELSRLREAFCFFYLKSNVVSSIIQQSLNLQICLFYTFSFKMYMPTKNISDERLENYFNNFCSGASLARTNQKGVQPWRQINSFPSSPSLINSLTPSHLFLKTPSPIAPSLLFKSLYDAEKFPQFRAIL